MPNYGGRIVGALEEVRLMIHSVVLDAARRVFGEGTDTRALKLVETQAVGSGIVIFM